jgi:hypothetical protein
MLPIAVTPVLQIVIVQKRYKLYSQLSLFVFGFVGENPLEVTPPTIEK